MTDPEAERRFPSSLDLDESSSFSRHCPIIVGFAKSFEQRHRIEKVTTKFIPTRIFLFNHDRSRTKIRAPFDESQFKLLIRARTCTIEFIGGMIGFR